MPKEKQTKKKTSILDKAFAQEYVKNGMNGRKAYRALRPNTTEGSATVQATRMLQRPNVIDNIKALLPSDDVESSLINTVLTKTKQPEEADWNVVHKFMKTSLELKGYLNTQSKQSQVNVAFIVNKAK